MTQNDTRIRWLQDDVCSLKKRIDALEAHSHVMWNRHIATPIFKIVAERPDLIPTYAKSGDAGMDLRANIQEPIDIEVDMQALIPTGIKIALEPGYEAQIRPRSGLAAKHAVTVTNSPGTIDSSYSGIIQVILINHGHCTFTVAPGDRIAQMVIARVEQVTWQVVDSLDETERGEGGFGSTGVK